jgi:4-diphosphocytidyl-2-C-methyl-D-erythritol kinase
MTTLVQSAPAKVNLVLHVGPRRPDGLHDICSLFASLELTDTVEVEPLPAGAPDEVVCDGVPGPNLAAAALEAFRAAAPGARLPPLRVRIHKRIPIAAGLGGGSADAAAVLRAANAIACGPLDASALRRAALAVGADVPSQVEPRHALVTGAGEGVEPVGLPGMALVLVPSRRGLSTAEVYAEADRIGSVRAELDPQALRALARAPLAVLARGMKNDLEAAALSLRPELDRTLAALGESGALTARVTGSGPTVFGVFPTSAEAEIAAARIPDALAVPLRDGPRPSAAPPRDAP